MKTSQACKPFGGKKGLADAVGLRPQTVYGWGVDVPNRWVRVVIYAIERLVREYQDIIDEAEAERLELIERKKAEKAAKGEPANDVELDLDRED